MKPLKGQIDRLQTLLTLHYIHTTGTNTNYIHLLLLLSILIFSNSNSYFFFLLLSLFHPGLPSSFHPSPFFPLPPFPLPSVHVHSSLRSVEPFQVQQTPREVNTSLPRRCRQGPESCGPSAVATRRRVLPVYDPDGEPYTSRCPSLP